MSIISGTSACAGGSRARSPANADRRCACGWTIWPACSACATRSTQTTRRSASPGSKSGGGKARARRPGRRSRSRTSSSRDSACACRRITSRPWRQRAAAGLAHLEYLSAEDWVESHHGLPSPQPDLPLTKYFFFPGFTEATGGLIVEHDLARRRDAFQADAAALADFRRRLGLGDLAPDSNRLWVSPVLLRQRGAAALA
ncbi:MAG: elongation factor P maturation arginine rhamnosyltransferase EarP [Rhodospirillales bacterium]